MKVKCLTTFILILVLFIPQARPPISVKSAPAVPFSCSQTENLLYLPLIQHCPGILEPFPNGDFEQGSAGWTLDQWGMAGVVNSIYGFTPHGGNWMGFLPRALAYMFPTIKQSVTIPFYSPYLAFWWSANTSCNPVSGDRCGTRLRISINDVPLPSISAELIQPWHKTVVDLSAYRGQTVLIGFENYNLYDNTQIALDDLSFQDCP